MKASRGTIRTGAVNRKQLKVLLWISVAIAVVLCFELPERYRLQCRREQTGFGHLEWLARRMVFRNAAGVVETPSGRCISSFEAFFEYVRQEEPKSVSRVDAPNPFPGLLPNWSYERLRGTTTQPSELLFWSRNKEKRGLPLGVAQRALTCDGKSRDNLIDSEGERLTRTGR